jgi:hypothetical protein
MKWFYMFFGFFILVSCQEEKPVVVTIEFKTDYLFNAEIEEKIASDTTKNEHFTGFKYQMAATDYATKGSYKEALIAWDSAMTPKVSTYTDFQIDSINNSYEKVNASNYIVEKSKKHQIVIINEAHHNAMHRSFTKSLLPELYDTGFRNLGLEALGNGAYLDDGLNSRKYPIQDTGFYIKDPQFGNLVRTALELGYYIFPYESGPSKNGKEREIEQAKNITKVLDSVVEGKTLIHCGFAHVLEGEYSYNSWGKTMAGRLAEYTGLDPFTINQVQFSEKSNPAYNHRFLKALKVTEPSVLIDENKSPYKYKRDQSWADIAVFHPNTKYLAGRPNWLFQNGNKKVMVTIKDMHLTFPVLVMAFKDGEDIQQAVPLDMVEVNGAGQEVVLGLKSGRYVIVVTNKKGDARKFELKVD